MGNKAILMRNGNAEDFTDFLIDAEQNFLLSHSNYTIAIDSELFKKKFVTTMQAPRTFGAFAKLKKDLKLKPVPEINKDSLRYYVHNFKKESFHKEVFNVDLKSAYATILFNDGLITVDTFNYLKKLTKQQRLAAVGMLAAHKDHFHFKKGKVIDTSEDTSPFANFFFHLVKRTSDIMDELKVICGQKHLFTWVDGIYFQPDENVMSECAAYLESIKFPYSMEYLTDFKVEIMQTYTRVSLKKDGKMKPFNLPHTDSAMKKIFKNAILKADTGKTNNAFDKIIKARNKPIKNETSKKNTKSKRR